MSAWPGQDIVFASPDGPWTRQAPGMGFCLGKVGSDFSVFKRHLLLENRKKMSQTYLFEPRAPGLNFQETGRHSDCVGLCCEARPAHVC